MVIEHALLRVRPGQEGTFESAMRKARNLIAASPGFLDLKVRKAVERDGLYLLLVRWEAISDHRDGFRKSSRYKEWQALLHGYYEPMPDIECFGTSIV